MDKFNLKSIEEFDEIFMRELREKAPAQEETSASVIPEISVNEPVPVKENVSEPTVETEPEAALPQPEFIPDESKNNVDIVKELYFDDDDDDDDEIKEKAPKGERNKGLFAGRIAATVLLAITVVTFVVGCFFSIFIDNKGASLKGTHFSTMALENDSYNVSKGDMIISKVADGNQYEQGALLVVRTDDGQGCDIMKLEAVVTSYNSEPVFSAVGSDGYTKLVPAESCLGKVSSYVPGVGGLLHFAMENIVLVSALFVLLAALWCLVLVLIERYERNLAAKKDDEE